MSIVVLHKKFNKMILNEIWLVFNHETISFVLMSLPINIQLKSNFVQNLILSDLVN